MTFERPWALLGLLALPLLAWLYVVLQRRRARYAVSFTNLAVLREVARRRAWRRYVPPVLLLLALAALVAGFARPHVRGLVPQDRATVVLVLDVSRSMEARDVKPTRLGAATRAIRLFLDRAPERLRIGMVVFAGVPQVASPPTTDHEQVSVSLDNLGDYATFGGTAIGDALSMAVDVGRETLERDRVDAETAPSENDDGSSKLVSILFLSDGAQREGVLQPLEGAQLAKVSGGGGGFVPFGSERIPVPPDPVTLRAIAETSGGEFTEARDADTLDDAYEKLGANLGRKNADKEVTYAFLLAAAGLLLGAGLLAARWSPRLP